MKIEKLIDRSDVEMPVIAALPFKISGDEREGVEGGIYNPELQLAFQNRGNYSTCREDDSAGFFNSKSDTKKDD